ncbi:Crp/Fnr family transcriptional regulator [Aminicella lysinilytica]|jgi:CRP/FNR family transcriptional regulator|uniref:Crp/Fnr family transcriptional regulator n=1 Tax=Aminicella lysinilytica TaxID=433323 RepID=UPI0026F0D29A|nr:Crp/Fnr family transcriptional regulator [Aminicella lysinilytica]
MNSADFTALLPFWDKLDSDEKQGIIDNTTLTEYSAGDQIHRGSNDCIGILLVRKGRLRTSMLSEDGREITLFHMEEGDFCVLSASCILNAVTFDVFIDAEKDASVYQISTPFFQQLTAENIYVENFMYKVALNRFSDVMWVMEQVLFMTMDKRLAMFLLSEQDENGQIRMTHDQIARHLGSAREVISRMLKYFVQEGLVSLSRGAITITSEEALSALAD